MKKINVFMATALLLVLFGWTSYLPADVLYVNDFGTLAQRNDWTYVSGKTWTESPSWHGDDLDGDTLSSSFLNALYGDSIYEKTVSAPSLQALDLTGLTFRGQCDTTNWAAYVYVRLSADGSNWTAWKEMTNRSYSNYIPETLDVSTDPTFQGIPQVWMQVRLGNYTGTANTSLCPKIRDVTLEGAVVPLLPPTIDSPSYVNDFGTVAQRTVGGGDWDSSQTIAGTPQIDYYSNGYNGISVDLDGDAVHGGLAANGLMTERYIKEITVANDRRTFNGNIEVLALGHADSSVSSTFSVGVSLDGITWDYVDTLSGEARSYPDNFVYVNVDDVNYKDITSFYIMIEWDNAEATTDPNLVAYITDVTVGADVIEAPVLDATHFGMYGHSSASDIDFSFNYYPINPAGWAYDTFANETDAQAFWDGVHVDRLAGKYRLPILHLLGTVNERKAQLDRMFSPIGNVTTYRTDLIGIAFKEEVTTTVDVDENELYDYVKVIWPGLQVYKFYSYPIQPLSFDSGVAEKTDGYLYDDYYTKTSDAWRREVMNFLVTGKPLIMTIWATEPSWNSSDPANEGYFHEDWVEGLEPYEQNGLVTNAPNSSLEQYFWMTSGILREFGMPVALLAVAGAGSSIDWWSKISSPNLEYIVEELAEPLRFEMRTDDGLKELSAEFSGSDGMDIDTGGAFSYTDDFKTDGLYEGLGTIDDASIIGFSNLLQTPDSNGVLVSLDDSGDGYVELVYRFYAVGGSLSSVSAELIGTVVPGQGGVNLLGLSKNGRDITTSVESTPGVGTEETIIVSGGGEYTDLEAFHVHVRMSYDSSVSGSPANMIRQLDVDASHNAAGTPAPEPDKCGDAAFLMSDITGFNRYGLSDCYVNFADFAAIAEDWMDCTDPGSEDCQ
jgi:hypothetical protein